jgi:hypothetical protein
MATLRTGLAVVLCWLAISMPLGVQARPVLRPARLPVRPLRFPRPALRLTLPNAVALRAHFARLSRVRPNFHFVFSFHTRFFGPLGRAILARAALERAVLARALLAQQLLSSATLPQIMPISIAVPVPIPSSEMMTSPAVGYAQAPPGAALLAIQPMPECITPPSQSQPEKAKVTQAEAKPQDPVDRVLVQMDIDHDGRISPREARGLWLALFTRLDQNNDGYLDRNELAAALKEFPGLRLPRRATRA